MGQKDIAREKLAALIRTLPHPSYTGVGRFIFEGEYKNFTHKVVGACGVSVIKNCDVRDIIWKALKKKRSRALQDRAFYLAEVLTESPEEIANGILKPAFAILDRVAHGRAFHHEAQQEKFVGCVIDIMFEKNKSISNLPLFLFKKMRKYTRKFESAWECAEAIAKDLEMLKIS